jgi:hypothetical protein
LSWSLLQGALSLVALLACVLWAHVDGAGADRLRAVALESLVAANLALIQVNRRHGSSAAAENRSFWTALLLVGAMLALLLGWAPLRSLLHLPAPELRDLGKVALMSVLLLCGLVALRRFRYSSALR